MYVILVNIQCKVELCGLYDAYAQRYPRASPLRRFVGPLTTRMSGVGGARHRTAT